MPQHEHEEYGVVTWTLGENCPACGLEHANSIIDRMVELHRQKDQVVREALDKIQKITRSGTL